MARSLRERWPSRWGRATASDQRRSERSARRSSCRTGADRQAGMAFASHRWGCSHCSSEAPSRCSPSWAADGRPVPYQALELLSYNVRYFGHGTRGLASTRAAMRRIADAIASLAPMPTIVCMQEVETRSIRSTVADRGTALASNASLSCSRPPSPTRAREDAYDTRTTSSPRLSSVGARPASLYTPGSRHPWRTRTFAVRPPQRERCLHDITHRRLHPIRRGFKQTRICARAGHRDRRAHGVEPIDVFSTHLGLPSALTCARSGPSRSGSGQSPNQLEEARNLVRFVEREHAKRPLRGWSAASASLSPRLAGLSLPGRGT